MHRQPHQSLQLNQLMLDQCCPIVAVKSFESGFYVLVALLFEVYSRAWLFSGNRQQVEEQLVCWLSLSKRKKINLSFFFSLSGVGYGSPSLSREGQTSFSPATSSMLSWSLLSVEKMKRVGVVFVWVGGLF